MTKLQLQQFEREKIRNIKELVGRTFMTSSACMSVWADGLSYANAHPNRITKNPNEAENIVVLSCQVTDLAVINDFRTLERYQKENPNKRYFISGCLANRLDIPLPEGVERLATPRENYQFIFDRTLVHFEKPFWVKDFVEEESETKDGHLFRYMYPLRIGKGCPNACTYCTIRITRGEFQEYGAERLESEFLAFDNVLLIADSPLERQIKDWYKISKRNKKPFSIRNVEPKVTVKCASELLDLADNALLIVYHSPIQSNNPNVLRDMNRDVDATLKTIELARELKKRGVYIATNIIIDYKDFKQDFSEVYRLYDYVSWNPLWDRVWDRKKAEARFEKYMNQEPEEVKLARINTGN